MKTIYEHWDVEQRIPDGGSWVVVNVCDTYEEACKRLKGKPATARAVLEYRIIHNTLTCDREKKEVQIQ